MMQRLSCCTIRGAALIGYKEAAASVGLNPSRMFELVGLEPTCDGEPDGRVALNAYLALLALSAERARCGDFGTRVAMAAGLPDYGPVSLIMREAETLEDAIIYCSRYLWMHCSAFSIRLHKRADDPLIMLDMPGNSEAEVVQITQFGIAGVTTQLSWLTGGLFRPKLISFTFPRPSNAVLISKIADCEIAYNQALSGTMFGHDLLGQQIVKSDPSIRRIALRHIPRLLIDNDIDFFASLVLEIRHLLPLGECSSRKVAMKFCIERRMLNRRLKQKGFTFLAVVQQVRTQLVIQALSNNNLNITDISNLVGFNDTSSFSRWFRGTFNCSASNWRRGVRPRGLSEQTHD